jgi:hypothetical protein
MTNRRTARLLAGALATASAGGALLGLASNGGELTAGGTHCSGGGDTDDVVVNEAGGDVLRAVPDGAVDPVLKLAGRR